jgi:hypothetical protein
VDLRRGHTFKAFRGPRAPATDPFRGSEKLWGEILEWLERRG